MSFGGEESMGLWDAQIDAANSMAAGGRWPEAIEAYAKVLAMGGSGYRLHFHYGVSLLRCGNIPHGHDQLLEALKYRPNSLEALDSLVSANLKLGNALSAEETCRVILADHPDYHPALNNLGAALIHQGRIPEGLKAMQHCLALAPGDTVTRDNLLMSLNFVATDGLDLVDAHRFACADLPCAPRMPATDTTGRRIRVGYISNDFRSHSVAFFLSGIIGTHDRGAFEVFCYSTNHGSDWMTGNFSRMTEHFVNISACSDTEAARLIQADQIDILVDLGGHAQGNRLGIFAQCPAPIQATYLGYPATTGCSFIDYRLVDTHTDPEGAEAFSTEQLVRLPAPFLCYYPHPDCPEVAPLPALATGYITFGSFNTLPKLSDTTLDLWTRVLGECPDSRMLLKSEHFSEEAVRAHFQSRFSRRGIHPSRITLMGHIPNTLQHLATYGSIDIALDSFPYNGTTTTCEALWMGVPVISLVGNLHAARVGYTLLSAVGLEGLATTSADEFVSLAATFADDAAQLSLLRKRLRTVVANSPHCDRFRLTRGLEDAYRSMLVPSG